MTNDDKEYIYVVLIKALTGLGKIGRKFMGYEYTHIAVSFDGRLEDFVTFSRRKHHSPFNAGYMHEKREHYAFGSHKRVKVKVFKLPVSTENMVKIKNYVNKIENDKEYIFNLYSMLTMSLIHGIPIYKSHNCMSFVGKVIALSEVVNMDREYYRYNIREMDELLKEYVYKECYLQKQREDVEYMRQYSMFSNMRMFFSLNAKLIYRMLFKANERYE